MRKYTLVSVIIFTVTISFAQHNEKIAYIFPDSVEMFIDSCIKKAEIKDEKFYLLLSKDTVYKITIGEYSSKDEKNVLKWVNQTNRYAIINKKCIPLIFDFDLKFAAINSNNIGEFGKREGNIKRISLMLHGVTISFKFDGTITNINNW